MLTCFFSPLCMLILRWHLQQICFFLTGKTLLELVIEQFEDLLVRILLLAACISFVSIKKFLYSRQGWDYTLDEKAGNSCLLSENILFGDLSCVFMFLVFGFFFKYSRYLKIINRTRHSCTENKWMPDICSALRNCCQMWQAGSL